MILKKGDWIDHVKMLKITVNIMKEKGLECNIENPFFRQTKI